MKKFEFNLQKLLDIREAAEKQVQNELAKLVNKQNAIRLKQQELQKNISNERKAFSQRIKESEFSYSDVLVFERFVDNSSRAIEFSEQQIEDMEYDVQKVRDRLVEVSKERKVVERLKENRWKEYQYELNRE
ncbi:MAG: flagellar export protein FliJ, partial [bacterium]|nr:flagellar export protein FliJ [bacterium]